jgi:hypothetical protein
MVGYDLEYLLLKEDMPNYHHQFFNLFISHDIISLSERFGFNFYIWLLSSIYLYASWKVHHFGNKIGLLCSIFDKESETFFQKDL